MSEFTVNPFRRARGRILRQKIDGLARHLGRNINILDVGGRVEYWDNIGLANIDSIVLINNEETELRRVPLPEIFTAQFGDARDLSSFADQAFDLVHSNSVIEHVGSWTDMCAMANEIQRVGSSGWVQTPAWEFPIEPHYRLPFLHWLAPPARRALLFMSPHYGRLSIGEKRHHIERINLVSYREFQSLFPRRPIYVERIALMPKSYVAHWLPASLCAFGALLLETVRPDFHNAAWVQVGLLGSAL